MNAEYVEPIIIVAILVVDFADIVVDLIINTRCQICVFAYFPVFEISVPTRSPFLVDLIFLQATIFTGYE